LKSLEDSNKSLAQPLDISSTDLYSCVNLFPSLQPVKMSSKIKDEKISQLQNALDLLTNQMNTLELDDSTKNNSTNIIATPYDKLRRMKENANMFAQCTEKLALISPKTHTLAVGKDFETITHNCKELTNNIVQYIQSMENILHLKKEFTDSFLLLAIDFELLQQLSQMSNLTTELIKIIEQLPSTCDI